MVRSRKGQNILTAETGHGPVKESAQRNENGYKDQLETPKTHTRIVRVVHQKKPDFICSCSLPDFKSWSISPTRLSCGAALGFLCPRKGEAYPGQRSGSVSFALKSISWEKAWIPA
jgi:hypothetical protein